MSTVICISLFAFLFKGWVFVAAIVHLTLILLSWRWWSPAMKGRRCDLFGMGVFSAVLNFVATIHTGEDASFVYQCLPYNSDDPHFLRGGAQAGAFLGLAVVQDVARVGYISGALVNGGGDKLHQYLALGMGSAFVVQHLVLLLYWLLWRKLHAAKAQRLRRTRSRSHRSLSSGSDGGASPTPPPPPSAAAAAAAAGAKGRPGAAAPDDDAVDIVNPVHRYSFGQRKSLAVSVASW